MTKHSLKSLKIPEVIQESEVIKDDPEATYDDPEMVIDIDKDVPDQGCNSKMTDRVF